MNETTLNNCRRLIENRDLVKSVFAWESGLIHLCCAGIYSSKGLVVDKEILKDSKKLIKESVGVFSDFRSIASAPVAAMISASGNPEETLEKSLQVYNLLKKEFWSSTYLPLAAIIIAQKTEPYRYEEIVSRTRRIYNSMKEEHPFLTASEDGTFCALMALSDKSDETLINEMEACYQQLKPNFFSSNAVQSLSHVLALCDGTISEKCTRTMQLFDKLKAAKRRYGTDYELPTLGVLAMSGADLESIVADMIEIDDWLAKQKGLGVWGGVGPKQRLMYAGILAQQDYINENAMQTAAIGSAVALLIAQEAAMCAAIAATTMATTNSANS